MLLTNRRHRLIFASLAALDVAGLLPWLALLAAWWSRGSDPLSIVALQFLLGLPMVAFLMLWLLQLTFILAADLLNRYQIDTPLREAAIFTLIVGSALVGVRFLLHADLPVLDFSWLREVGIAVFDFTAALRGELIVLLLAFFLWWRVARYTDRGINFLAIGVAFRLGLLLALAGNGILAQQTPQRSDPSLIYFSLYILFGLLAVSLTRIDQKAVGASNSSGTILPWSRLTQLLIAAGAILSAGWALAIAYSPTNLRIFLSWFGPVGTLIQWLLLQVVFLFFWVFGPMLEALAAYLYSIMEETPAQEMNEFATPIEPVTITGLVREWAMLRYCLVTLAIVVVLGLIWLFFVRTRLFDRRNELEETAQEDLALQTPQLSLNWERLRSLFGMLGRYGLGRQLLAAISVENMYANLIRLARRQGHVRPSAQPPERFLPTLREVFPGNDRALAQITYAYLQVRYGEHPVGEEELNEIRQAYTAIMDSLDEASSASTAGK